MTAVRTNSSSSNEEKPSLKNNTPFRKQMSTEETKKRPTLLDEAASHSDGKPAVVDGETEM